MPEPASADQEAADLYNRLIRLTPEDRAEAERIAFRLQNAKRKHPNVPSIRVALIQAYRATGKAEHAQQEAETAYYQASLLPAGFRRDFAIQLGEIGAFRRSIEVIEGLIDPAVAAGDGALIAAYRNAAFGSGDVDLLEKIAEEPRWRHAENASDEIVGVLNEPETHSLFKQRQTELQMAIKDSQVGYSVAVLREESGLEITELISVDANYKTRRELEYNIDLRLDSVLANASIASRSALESIVTIVVPVSACRNIYIDPTVREPVT